MVILSVSVRELVRGGGHGWTNQTTTFNHFLSDSPDLGETSMLRNILRLVWRNLRNENNQESFQSIVMVNNAVKKNCVHEKKNDLSKVAYSEALVNQI